MFPQTNMRSCRVCGREASRYWSYSGLLPARNYCSFTCSIVDHYGYYLLFGVIFLIIGLLITDIFSQKIIITGVVVTGVALYGRANISRREIGQSSKNSRNTGDNFDIYSKND